MKTIEVSSASKYSRGKARNRKTFAQVTFLTGEGSARRSNTAHPEYKPGYGYVGFNPDSRAIPLNERYSQELAEAQSDLARAEAALATLQKKLEVVRSVEPVDAVEIAGVVAATAMLVSMIEIAEAAIGDGVAALLDADKKLDIVRREIPLEVAFDGPGLSY